MTTYSRGDYHTTDADAFLNKGLGVNLCQNEIRELRANVHDSDAIESCNLTPIVDGLLKPGDGSMLLLFLPDYSRGMVCTNGDPVWVDAASLDEMVAAVLEGAEIV